MKVTPRVYTGFTFAVSGLMSLLLMAGAGFAEEKSVATGWPQWRGPTRDGLIAGPVWPDRLTKDSLEQLWRIPLGDSYSGPIVTDDLVFTTETRNNASAAVVALDRKTGKQRWTVDWKDAMRVPFFASSNGSWVRSTPAYDGECLYVASMRDVLVCLEAATGKERWRVNFVENFKTPVPAFGFVCSPLVDGDAVYVQAGGSVFRLAKATGAVVWRALKDEGGMNGSAFSSPVLAKIAGQQQLIVQTRQKLAGVDPESGKLLWTQVVPAFRGMNIVTPVVVGDGIFTSSYQNKSWLYHVTKNNADHTVAEAWSNNAQGYMSTPVVINGYVYLHLGNQRFTCINLGTGERVWTSPPFGKYASLVAQGDRILALDQRGELLLIKANPKQFELVDNVKIADAETWAHLAISGDELFIRELGAIAAYRWKSTAKP